MALEMARFSTHKRSPLVRINGPPLPLESAHKRSPHPCMGTCRTPVEAAPAAENGETFVRREAFGALTERLPGSRGWAVVRNPGTGAGADRSKQCSRNTRLRREYESGAFFTPLRGVQNRGNCSW